MTGCIHPATKKGAFYKGYLLPLERNEEACLPTIQMRPSVVEAGVVEAVLVALGVQDPIMIATPGTMSVPDHPGTVAGPV